MTTTPRNPSLPLLVPAIPQIHGENRYSTGDSHKASIFHRVCIQGGVTRKELSEILGIRPGTVSSLVQELCDDRLISEQRTEGARNRGRPEIPLYANYDRWVTIVIHNVSMELRGAVVNAGDRLVAQTARKVPRATDMPGMRDTIIQIVRELLRLVPANAEVLGLAITIPGIINSERRELTSASRWPKLRHFSVQEIQRRLGIPVIIRRNLDVQLEYLLMRDPQYREGNTLLYHWGYGIGGAFASNGSVIDSPTGTFCQIGHLRLKEGSTKRCHCGQRGCLETEAALWALLPHMRRLYGKVPENEADFERFFASSHLEKDQLFRSALESVISGLALLLGVLVPDRVLIYGPFLARPAVLKTVEAAIARSAPSFLRGNVVLKIPPDPLLGDIYGSSAPFFREAYRRGLARRRTPSVATGRGST